ncbi:sigma factor-like helix-turn-helix DNA-binding protein [Sporomusa aerivorans]|uniref:sigma factor-like helix-turn-helix DNA-binding protein n=1 Tax=Sporomusa aerivorans TaxID=204936 RepID=UPI00352AF57D
MLREINVTELHIETLHKILMRQQPGTVEYRVIQDIINQIQGQKKTPGKPKTAPTDKIFKLRIVEGKTQEQIAQELGVSLSTVRRELKAGLPDLLLFKELAQKANAEGDDQKLAGIMSDMERGFEIPALADNLEEWKKDRPGAEYILKVYRDISNMRNS